MIKNDGVTLLELMSVLIIVGFLSSLVFTIWRSVDEQNSLAQTQNEIDIIIEAARAWKINKTSYAGITLDVLCKEKLLPNYMCAETSTKQGDKKVAAINANEYYNDRYKFSGENNTWFFTLALNKIENSDIGNSLASAYSKVCRSATYDERSLQIACN